MLSIALVLVGSALLLATASGSAWAMPVSQCGASVPAGRTGVLTVDLACDPSVVAVSVGAEGRLKLAGHVISGGLKGVQCDLGCSIQGPGEITGAVEEGIVINDFLGFAESPRVVVKNLRVHHNGGNGIYGFNRVGPTTLRRVEVDHNLNGINSTTAGDVITGRDVNVHDNQGVGIYGSAISLRRLTLTNNGVGGAPGLFSEQGSAFLIDSVVTGNAASIGGMDIATYQVPQLVRTTCGRSFQVPFDGPVPFPDGPTWGVCAND